MIQEGQSLVVPYMAQDFDLPAQNLTFRLDAAPAGAALTPTNGVFSWTPDFDQGPSTNRIVVSVTDDGEPGMTATTSFSVVVQEANQVPVLPTIAPQTVNELMRLTVTNMASEANLHATVSYALLNPPAGADITANGVITWAPGEAQGPGTNVISKVATSTNLLDPVNPTLSATNRFTVVVNEENTPPALSAVSNYKLHPGQVISFTATATDSDIRSRPTSFASRSTASSVRITRSRCQPRSRTGSTSSRQTPR